jgi:predicted RND superfamily exporter protein
MTPLLTRSSSALAGLRTWLVARSMAHPRAVIAATAVITVLLGAQIPRIRIDTDPTHMLPADFPVRRYNDRVDRDFALHPNVVVVGMVRPAGILTGEGLRAVADLTEAITRLPGVAARDVSSLATVEDLTADGGTLHLRPLLASAPAGQGALASWRARVLSNPLFRGRYISADGTATALYVPVTSSGNSKAVADSIRGLLPRDGTFYVTGDSVARDTLGAEVFGQMAIFSPLAALTMCLVLWFVFRSGLLIAANMAVACISAIWSMGLFVALGVPIHIMSSMAPVFLMAIATDTVHIFNELAFRFHETGDKRRAIGGALAAVGGPIALSDVTTAIGFASLATATILPIKIFGLTVAVGTLVILLTSFTLVPAILALVPPERLPRPRRTSAAPWLERLGRLCVRRARAIGLASLAVLLVAGLGLSRIRVNDNIIHWFKPGSALRTADTMLNEKLGGSATGYLVVEGAADDALEEPSALALMDGLQRELEKNPRVGKTSSVVDSLRRTSLVLHDGDPRFDRIPATRAEAAQYLLLLGMSARPEELDHAIDPAHRQAIIFLQLRSWDSDVMKAVLASTEAYLAGHHSPAVRAVRPAGVATFNLGWSAEVLSGMLESFSLGLAVVLLVLVLAQRSLVWGAVTFLPLLATIVVLYGAVGLIGKDFDMAIAVLSTLSVGLAIDFAIHFVGRLRERMRERGPLSGALVWTVARPGRGIALNAVLFAFGFSTMVFADLMPYVTVAVLMIAIMLVAAVLTLLLLPGVILRWRRWLFAEGLP